MFGLLSLMTDPQKVEKVANACMNGSVPQVSSRICNTSLGRAIRASCSGCSSEPNLFVASLIALSIGSIINSRYEVRCSELHDVHKYGEWQLMKGSNGGCATLVMSCLCTFHYRRLVLAKKGDFTRKATPLCPGMAS